MGSKSVLILGIVFIFLLNVLAVHNYIDSYYYQPNKIVKEKDNNLSISSMIKDIIKIKEDENDSDIAKEGDNETITEIATKVEETKMQETNKTEVKKSKDITKPEVDLLSELSNDVKDDNQSLKNKTKDTKITNKKDKKDKKIEEDDDSEKNAYIVLNLNVNDSYQKGNPIIKKMVKRLDNKKVIKIKIYKYSMKIKDYLKEIKDEIVDYGVDVDNIKVIYKKNENKKDKIKILLTKKD